MDISLQKLLHMKNVALNPVNKEHLVDIRDVKVNQQLPISERIREFISQVKNPYLYKYGDKVIMVSFTETETTFEDRMKGYFEML